MDDLAALAARAQTISRLIPLLNAIRSVAEIAWRRAEAGFQPLASYAERVQTTVERVASSMHDAQRQNLLAGWEGQRPVALLLVTSERGLCGPFNSHVVQAGLQEAQAWSALGRTVNFLCLGSKGRRGLEAYGQSVAYGGPLPSFSVPSYISIEQVALDLLDLLEQGTFGQLMIIYNAPVGRFQYGISKKQLLPPAIHIRQSRPRRITVKPANDVPALVNHLLTEYLLVGLYQVVLESVISEQLARIYTMRLATENAQKLLDDLNLQYNLAQRQQITNSLLEIVSGYGATLRRVP
jgi:F-type H+-transporting ATPase subunit gamma